MFKLYDLLKAVIEMGKASEQDYLRLVELMGEDSNLMEEDSQKFEELLRKALKISPKSEIFWNKLLEVKMEKATAKEDIEALMKLFDEALSQVRGLDLERSILYGVRFREFNQGTQNFSLGW